MRLMGRVRVSKVLFAFGLSVLLFVASACAGDDRATETDGDADAQSQEIDVLLSFVHDMINIHHYWAQDNGWNELCGIETELLPAAEVENPTQILLGGQVDYAIVDPFTVISGVQRGLPIVAIAEDLARTGITYTSLEETGIEGPEDLPGHVVGAQQGGEAAWVLDRIMAQTLTSEQIEQVRVVPVGFDLQPLLSGRVDVYPLYLTNTNINAAILEGHEFNFIRAYEHGIGSTGNVIITTREKVEEEPEEVLGFLAAAMKGMEESLREENREDAIEATLKRFDEPVDRDVLGLVYERLWDVRTHPLWEANGVGWNDPEAWAAAQDILLEEEVIEERTPIDEFYTNEFLEQIMNENGEVDLEGACG